jgi:hypothetical protein
LWLRHNADAYTLHCDVLYVEKLLRLLSELSVVWNFAFLMIIVVVPTNSVVVAREFKV